jgi:hypothetical protein
VSPDPTAVEQALFNLGYRQRCSGCDKPIEIHPIPDYTETGWPQGGVEASEYPARYKRGDLRIVLCSPACALRAGIELARRGAP